MESVNPDRIISLAVQPGIALGLNVLLNRITLGISAAYVRSCADQEALDIWYGMLRSSSVDNSLFSSFKAL